MTDADARRQEMRALVAVAHAEQRRNAGRVPYAAHVISVGEILREALAASGDLDGDPALALDLYLAAVGHDLYEDTAVTPAEIRQRFGPRVDALIEAMTNRRGDHDRAVYLAAMRAADEAVRLVKIADLIDNVTSCAYGIHDLGERWIRDTFVPIADEMSRVVAAAPYVRFATTARLMLGWLDFALARLRTNLEIHRGLDTREPSAVADAAASSWADWDGELGGKAHADAVERAREREWREGALSKGGPVVPPRRR